MQLCVSVWFFFLSLNIHVIIILYSIYLCCTKSCVEGPQAGSPCWGRGCGSLFCPAHGLSPEKFHFWAELKPRSCWEAVSVVGLLLAGPHGCSAAGVGLGLSPKSLPAEMFREWVDTSKNKSSSGM